MWQAANSEQDRDLVLKSRAGDEQAFEELIRKYQQALFQVAYKSISNPAEVEDVIQKIVTKVYFSLESYDDKRPFYPWLYRIAVNQCFDELRRKKRRRTFTFTDLNLEETPAIEAFLNSARPDLDEEDAEELHALLHKVLDQLPEKHRRIIVLRDLQQTPYSELSSLLGCSEQAARLKVLRARLRLRDLMVKALRRNRLKGGYCQQLPSWIETLVARTPA